MLILALETSSTLGSIALGTPEKVVNEIEFASEGRHSKSLFPSLSKLGLPRLKLEKIVVGLGPGSFSGIRVALAAAHGIALVQKVPIYGICSAYSVAKQLEKVTRLGVFADARRGEYYSTVFQQGQLEREPYLVAREEVEDEMSKMTLAVSAETLPGIRQQVQPRARDLLGLSPDLRSWKKGPDLEPIYLRAPLAPPVQKEISSRPLSERI